MDISKTFKTLRSSILDANWQILPPSLSLCTSCKMGEFRGKGNWVGELDKKKVADRNEWLRQRESIIVKEIKRRVGSLPKKENDAKSVRQIKIESDVK